MPASARQFLRRPALRASIEAVGRLWRRKPDAFQRESPNDHFSFRAHQDAIQFDEAKLKNSIYALYFTNISMCKQDIG